MIGDNTTYKANRERYAIGEMRRARFARSDPMSLAERQELIDEAVAAGRVTKCPPATVLVYSIPLFNSLGTQFGSKRGSERA